LIVDRTKLTGKMDASSLRASYISVENSEVKSIDLSDAVVDDVLLRVLSFFNEVREIEDVLQSYPLVQIESA